MLLHIPPQQAFQPAAAPAASELAEQLETAYFELQTNPSSRSLSHANTLLANTKTHFPDLVALSRQFQHLNHAYNKVEKLSKFSFYAVLAWTSISAIFTSSDFLVLTQEHTPLFALCSVVWAGTHYVPRLFLKPRKLTVQETKRRTEEEILFEHYYLLQHAVLQHRSSFVQSHP